MSSSSLYKVYRTKVECVETLKNSWGTAPPLWGWLGMNYLDWDNPHVIFRNMDALWKLATDPRVPVDVRLCHVFTFDYAVVGKKDTERMAVACKAVHTLLNEWPPASGWVNHWESLWRFFGNVKLDSRCLGIGIGCTSVCDPWFETAKFRKGKMFEFVDDILGGR